MSPVKYELGFYVPEDGILHSHRREHLKPYIGKIMFAVSSFHNVDILRKNTISFQTE
jgi:hypothetical protein